MQILYHQRLYGNLLSPVAAKRKKAAMRVGDKDSDGGTPNGNLSSQEDSRDGYESSVMGDFHRRRQSDERLELLSTGKEEQSPDFIVDVK